jgi:hypothetical protein
MRAGGLFSFMCGTSVAIPLDAGEWRAAQRLFRPFGAGANVGDASKIVYGGLSFTGVCPLRPFSQLACTTRK